MALKIKIDTPTGAQAEYWRLGDHMVQPKAAVTAQMLGYISQDAREASAMPAGHITIVLPLSPDENATMPWVYEQVKANPDFAGAVDC